MLRNFVALAFTAMILSSAACAGELSPIQRFLFSAVNQSRSTARVAPLHWDDSLATAARAHVRLMAQHHKIAHQLSGESPLTARLRQAGASFSAAAENIALGAIPERLHEQWMRSPGHRRNILDPRMTAIGIAVEQVGEDVFGVEDFSRSAETLSLREQEARVAGLLRAAGLKISSDDSVADARASCAGEQLVSRRQPAFLARFETPDLNELPEQLQEKIRGGAYRTAAVGACADKETSAFTRFRVAVLLFQGG